MSGENWKTLRVPPEAYEQAKAQKEANGRTWGEQLVNPDGDAEADDDLAELRDAIETVEARTGRIERTVDELGEGRR